MAAAAAMASALRLSYNPSPDTGFANLVEFLEELGKQDKDFHHYANPLADFTDKDNVAKAWAGLVEIRNAEIRNHTGTV